MIPNNQNQSRSRLVMGGARTPSQDNLQRNTSLTSPPKVETENNSNNDADAKLNQAIESLNAEIEKTKELTQKNGELLQQISEHEAKIEFLTNQNKNLNETIQRLRSELESNSNNQNNNNNMNEINVNNNVNDNNRVIELENKVKELENKVKELEANQSGNGGMLSPAAMGGGPPPPPPPPVVGGGPPPPPPPAMGGGPPPPPPPAMGGGPPPPPPPPMGGGPPPPPPPGGLGGIKGVQLRSVSKPSTPAPSSPAPVDSRSALLDSITKGVQLKKTTGPKPADEKLKEIEAKSPRSPANNHMAALAAALASKRTNGEDLLKKLEQRPTRKELEDKNILKDGEGADSSIVSAKFSLKKAQERDNLNKKISNRPSPESLQEKNILPSDDNQPEWMKKRLALKKSTPDLSQNNNSSPS